MTQTPNLKVDRVSRHSFGVTVGGKALEPVALSAITKMTVRSDMEGLARFELKIRNSLDAKNKRYLYSDQEIYLPGKTIQIQLGYLDSGGLKTVFDGDITEFDATFAKSKPSFLQVRGISKYRRLINKQIAKVYVDKSDIDIIKAVASNLSLSVKIEAGGAGTQQVEYELQATSYDLIFLIEKSRFLGFDMHLMDGGKTLYVGKAGGQPGGATTLIFGRALTSFKACVDTAAQVSEVTVLGWDSKLKQPIKTTVARSAINEKTPWAGAVKLAYADRCEVMADVPVNDETTAKSLAKATMQRIANCMVTGEGTTMSTPELMPGVLVKLEGLDRRFSGHYRVTAVEHQIDERGLKTWFAARMEAA